MRICLSYFRGPFLLAAMMAALLACGGEREGSAPIPQGLEKDEKNLARKIQESTRLVELYPIRKQIENSESISEELENYLNRSWQALLKESRPQEMVKGLEFLSADLEISGPEAYTLRVLFRCSAPIEVPEDKSYHFTITGRVDDRHRSAIPSDAAGKPKRGYVWWHYLFWEHPQSTPVAEWETGEYYMIELPVETLEHVPYNVSLVVATRSTEDRRWVENIGETARAGWLVDF